MEQSKYVYYRPLVNPWAVGSLVVRASDSRPGGLGLIPDATKYPPSTHGALPVDPERKEWLTERSRCYFKMLQPEVALKHVNEVLALDPKYFQALLLKGEILYSMWDLERAMLCFVEGRRLRPDNTECIRGVHKIRMALDEISAYRDATTNGKRKKIKSKRSKSELVYRDAVTTQMDSVARLHAACTSVDPVVLRHVMTAIPRRAQACLDMHNRHFEHLP
ncbi:TPR_REGION domain-containing protein [Trichonephila clavipes]|nr:TPR_REGION domain-containing protein [Trichonephila clavipes]